MNQHEAAIPKQSAEEGSALYYAMLYIEDAAAQRAIDTLQFVESISAALHEVSDSTVAQKKIHWWHEELARLAKQQARHPACTAVQGYLHKAVQVKDSLSVLSVSSNERFTTYQDDHALNTALIEEYGARLRLLEYAVSAENSTSVTNNALPMPNASQPVHNAVALALAKFERLNTLVMLLRSGYAVFSDERYAKFATSPEALLRYSNHSIANLTQNTAEQTPQTVSDAPTDNSEDSTDDIDAMMDDVLQDTLSALAHAINQMDNAKQTTVVTLPVQILCNIRHAQVKLWHKRQPNLLRESVKLTPLRKFFIAYRCKRRFTKSARS